MSQFPNGFSIRNDRLNLDNVQISGDLNVGGNIHGNVIPPVEIRSSGGDLNIDGISFISGTNNFNLPNGRIHGHIKHIIAHDTLNLSIIPETRTGSYNQVNLTTIGQSISLMWTPSGWAIFGRASGEPANSNAVALYAEIV